MRPLQEISSVKTHLVKNLVNLVKINTHIFFKSYYNSLFI